MSERGTNIHGTAIVIGTKGVLFTGPSGIGKSMLAFACMVAARRQDVFSTLISDDQVLVSSHDGRIIASRPESIAGLIELRGSGIVMVESIASAPLDLAVSVISLPEAERLPPENERFEIYDFGSLPLVRLWNGTPEPLAILAALVPDLHSEIRF